MTPKLASGRRRSAELAKLINGLNYTLFGIIYEYV